MNKPLYTFEEAMQLLCKEEVTLKNLCKRKKISYCKGRPITFRPEHIEDYIQSVEVKRCAVPLNSYSSEIAQETLNPNAGTSSTTKEEVDAYLRGIKLARKTMKPNSRYPTSSSSGKGPSPEMRVN